MTKWPDNIVIGTPPKVDGEPDITWEEFFPALGITDEEHTVFEQPDPESGQLDLHLPRILVKHGFAKSTSIIRKAVIGKDQLPLVRDLSEPEFTRIKFGHRVVWLVVGELPK